MQTNCKRTTKKTRSGNYGYRLNNKQWFQKLSGLYRK